MSITKQLTIWCDRNGCHNAIQIDEGSVGTARKQAWHEGWVRVGFHDYCPACARTEIS